MISQVFVKHPLPYIKQLAAKKNTFIKPILHCIAWMLNTELTFDKTKFWLWLIFLCYILDDKMFWHCNCCLINSVKMENNEASNKQIFQNWMRKCAILLIPLFSTFFFLGQSLLMIYVTTLFWQHLFTNIALHWFTP